jgi:hypothetical protein
MRSHHKPVGHYQPIGIAFDFLAQETSSEVRVRLVTGVDKTYQASMIWSGTIPVGRSALRGHNSREAATILAGSLYDTWRAARDAERQAQVDAGVTFSMAKPPAPPEGDKGAVVDVPLPGL